MEVKVRNGTLILHTAYNECSNQSLVTMKMKVIAIATILALVLTLGVLTTLHAQFAFARLVLTPDFWGIQSVNRTGYIVCNPDCHLSSNSRSGKSCSISTYCKCTISSIRYFNSWHIYNNYKWIYRPSRRTHHRWLIIYI